MMKDIKVKYIVKDGGLGIERVDGTGQLADIGDMKMIMFKDNAGFEHQISIEGNQIHSKRTGKFDEELLFDPEVPTKGWINAMGEKTEFEIKTFNTEVTDITIKIEYTIDRVGAKNPYILDIQYLSV